MSVQFTDNSVQVKAAMDEAVSAFLSEAGGEVVAHASRHSPKDTGQLRGSWASDVNESKAEVKVGSPLENAIWNEFGTGEYAAEGKGRKGGWYVPADKLSAKAKTKMRKVVINGKEFYFTKGKRPQRTLENAFTKNKSKLKKRAEEIFKEKLGDK